MDAAHSARFARWYLSEPFPRLAAGTHASVHDVFHGTRAWPLTEGAVRLSWLRRTGRPSYTVSAARAPLVNHRLRQLREELGLGARVHTGSNNPMVFFTF